MHLAVIAFVWLLASVWIFGVLEAGRGLPKVPNLLNASHDVTPDGMPSVTVIVPGRNEEKDISACLESLLAQDYPSLLIQAVNDRSDDRTGSIMDTLAAAYPDRLAVLHIEALPPGWLGKTHAMAVAATGCTSDFLLFTDADIFFRPDALRRALSNAVTTDADHFVLFPTTVIRRWDEGAFLGFVQTFGLWAARPWKVADPRSRDAIGVGAFNLIKRSAYLTIGGFDAFPMEIIEDLGLARRIKKAGLRQRVAFGRGLVSVHWASGVPGLVGVMTKNIFSAFNFHIALVFAACLGLSVVFLLPFAALFYPPTLLPALLIVAAMALAYHLMSPFSGISALNALLAPFAAIVVIYALLRSMIATLRQGGVVWRGTFYSLAELRKNTAPLL